jgi:hypothetical protein
MNDTGDERGSGLKTLAAVATVTRCICSVRLL